MEALLYRPLENRAVRCELCAHRCKILPGQRGICRVRENRDGQLVSLVYGQLIAQHVDPIEKKPLFHLLPDSRAYSIATVGCNFSCRFCQNADIAQMPSDHQGAIVGRPVTPEAVVADARAKACASIAYTYTEPTVFFEFALDVARQAHTAGLRNIFVTNGYMSAKALDMILPVLDAANVDLKSFSEAFYRDVCGARLAPVKDTLIRMKRGGILVEVTTLLIPGLNDSPEELQAIADFLAKDLGPETPWHISRFHPTHRMMDRTATPVKTLAMARDIGMAAGLRYVYMGNVPDSGGENTLCPDCGNIVINRFQYRSRTNLIDGNHCAYCNQVIDGLF
ncbi:MAG: AmmeMemoRadiSam system radical SAM enzyme [Deltaproteobacteria bacterium]|nr:AmmeMemoRadiSam system radical SAM enzyme [Deltaproteobacteria bacterium]